MTQFEKLSTGSFGLEGVAKGVSTGEAKEVTQSKTLVGVRGVSTPAGEEVFMFCIGDALYRRM